MPSSWRLFESSHNGTLTVASPGDTPLDITSYLADDAQKVVLDTNAGTGIVTDIIGPPPQPEDPDDNTIVYEMRYTNKQFTRHIYIGGFDPNTDWIIRVFSTDDYDIGYTSEAIYEYGSRGVFEATPVVTTADQTRDTAFKVSLETADQRVTDKFKMSAPFFGIDTNLGQYCYEGGREHRFAGKMTFQETKTSRYTQSAGNFQSKTLVLPSVELDLESFFYKKLQALHGRLVLLEEDYNGTNKEYLLGYLDAKISNRKSSGRSRFSFTVNAKHL